MAHARALIFVNGERINLDVIRAWVRPDDFLIAADGGLRFLRALDRSPDLVVGDLDSLAPGEIERLRAVGVALRQFPAHKDETDLELAILAAVEQGAGEIWLVAALGGRLDMTLANIALLGLPELAGLAVRLEDGYDSVFLIRPEFPGEIHGEPGQVVSLLPYNGPAYGVRTEQLEYPLKAETLWPERSRGISNRMLADTARVSLESGLLLCVHSHHRLMS